MKVIKRNGSEVIFDITKIIIAVTRANESVAEADRMTPVQIQRIAQSVELQCQQMGRSPQMPVNPQQEPGGQVPLNGGGYVPPPVPVKRGPFVMTDAYLLILSAVLLALLHWACLCREWGF